jgi:hypothetical protein
MLAAGCGDARATNGVYRMDLRGLLREWPTDEQYAVTLWYAPVPLARLLADVEIMGRGLGSGAVMRVYSNQQEALTAVPALCAARGFELLPPYDRDGDDRGEEPIGIRPYGLYRFDIRARDDASTTPRP